MLATASITWARALVGLDREAEAGPGASSGSFASRSRSSSEIARRSGLLGVEVVDVGLRARDRQALDARIELAPDPPGWRAS